MARPLRIQFPGAFYHITARGNEKKDIFRNNRDRERFLSYLASSSERYGAIVHAYCLMDNHYHLILQTPQANLSQIMQHINGAYTIYFNIKRKRVGHLFQGRYKAILVDQNEYAQELSCYVHLNPFRSKIVKDPKDYPWSSYPYYIGLRKEPRWLTTKYILSYFGNQDKDAREGYRKFAEMRLSKRDDDLLKKVVASTLLGSKEFIDWVKENFIDKRKATRDLPALKRLVTRPSIQQIDKAVRKILRKNHPLGIKVSIYLSHKLSGLSLKEIGIHFGKKGAAVSQASRRMKLQIKKDKKLKHIVDRIMKEL